MKVQQITIDNIGCIQHLEILPGTITVLKGRNGTGKTSAIDAVAALIEGGHRPALVRKGAKKGVITLKTDECTIQRTITAKDSTYKITSPDGSEVKRPAEFIKNLTTSFSFNPMEFIGADPKAKAKYLLSCCPVVFEHDEVAAACEDSNVRDAYDLEQFNLLRDGKYGSRRDVNRDVKEAESTLATLENLTTDDSGVDWTAEAVRREDALREAEHIENELVASIERGAYAEQQSAKVARDAEVGALMFQIDEIRTRCEEKCHKIAEVALMERESHRAQSQPALELLIAAKAEAQEKAAAQQRAKGAASTVASIQAALDAKRKEAIKLDRVVQALDELKQKKMAMLPIQGVEVRDGEIYMDGIPFERLNLQKQIFLSFELGGLRMGRLPLVVADNWEHVDRRNFDEFVEAIRGTGWQVIVAQVDADAEQLLVQAVA